MAAATTLSSEPLVNIRNSFNRARAIAAAALIALAGCDSFPGALTDPDGTSSGSPGLIIVNEVSFYPILEVYFNPCSDASWGPNRLGSAESIQPLGSRSWSTAAGCHDVQVRFSTGYASPIRVTIPPNATYTLRITSRN
jgi:hypothetical protein